MTSKVSYYLTKILDSPVTYTAVLGFFALQLVYLAFIMNYPALFDEEYHLGIIEIYSRNLSPFIATQPAEAAFHGDITRYGSYLFHYLMSFPYWLVSHLTSDIKTQVITMRLICISFILLGVVMWRQFLLRAGVSKRVVLVVTFFFTMIPLVSLALSQINYDSLGFLIIPTILYVATRVMQEKNQQAMWLLLLLILALLGSLVKFTILPIAFVAVCVSLFYAYKHHRKKIITNYKKQLSKLSMVTRAGLIALTLCSFGLFIERYGVNIITYKNIEPKCDQVHSRESCMNYTVYKRDTTWRESNDKKKTPRDSPYTYTTEYWAPHIFNDFFVVGALVPDTEKPLTIRYLPENISANGGINTLRVAGWLLFISSVLLIAVRTPYLWRKYKTLYILVGGILLVYTIALWTRNYTDYLKIGAGTAAQGRYYIPLLVGIFTLATLSMGSLLHRLRYKLILLAVGLLIISQGGGMSTYILRSKDSWYWADQRETISNFHQDARSFLRTYIRP
jgi:hypothetical protein